MDAIKMLKDDHHAVKDLLRDYGNAGSDAFKAKQQIADQVFAALEVHTTLEEEIFYPAVKAKTNDEGKRHIAEGMEEHHVVKILIDELKTLTPEDEAFAAKFKVLSENVEHHIKEEEDELLPDAKKKLGHDGIEVLGDQMESRRQELKSASPGVAVVAENGHVGDGDDVRDTHSVAASTQPTGPSGPLGEATPRA